MAILKKTVKAMILTNIEGELFFPNKNMLYSSENVYKRILVNRADNNRYK